ncbi:hypothetical protein [Nocardia sp. NPDC052112]|uniref:hypothetical protein n=1 Tax=Nocardia sp. NPDC052112 TaxID=3155646 RepID=UPI003435D6D9
MGQWLRERRPPTQSLFASRERSGAVAVRMLFAGAMLGYFTFIALFFQGVQGDSPLIAGFAFLPVLW